MADIQMTVGETHETQVFTWTDNGSAVDLTGATVTARLEPTDRVAPGTAGQGTTTVTNASAGTLTYKFAAADTTAPGTYVLQFKAVFADSSVLYSRLVSVEVDAAV